MTDEEKQALIYMRVAEDAINTACLIAVKALKQAGDRTPVYTTAAAVYDVLCKILQKFYEHAGYSPDDAADAMKKAMAPLGDLIDDVYHEGHEGRNPRLPPVSLN